MGKIQPCFHILLLVIVVFYSLGSCEYHEEALADFSRKEMGMNGNQTILQNILHHKNYNLLASMKDCGQPIKHSASDRAKRVVGGRRTRFHPWMAQIYLHNMTTSKFDFNCGGSIISSRVILTAAHCISRIPTGTSLVLVAFGETDRRKIHLCTTDGVYDYETLRMRNCSVDNYRQVESTVIHENYSEGNLQYDIGLIKLAKDIEFSPQVQPICLPYGEELLDNWKNYYLTTIGFGVQNKYDDDGVRQLSHVLQETEIPLRRRKYCELYFVRKHGKFDSSRFCAGGVTGKGNCNGDSGSPVLKEVTVPALKVQRIFQFGMVSAGFPNICGWQSRPDIYINVLHFMPWILDNIDFHVLEQVYIKEDKYIGPLRPVSHAYKSEFSTGMSIDVTNHPNIHLLPDPSFCGINEKWLREDMKPRHRSKRIVGGLPATSITRFPWMAQIYVRDSSTDLTYLRCGGTIITAKFILTAARCMTDIDAPFVLDYVIVGNYNRNNNHSSKCYHQGCFQRKIKEISNYIPHPEFTTYTHENDVGLLELERPLTFSRFVRPICLPLTEKFVEEAAVSPFTLAGWGRTMEMEVQTSFFYSNILEFIKLTVRPREVCDLTIIRALGKLSRNMICAGGIVNIGGCKGDAGGPLMREVNGITEKGQVLQRFYQFGILSNSECGNALMPSIFTNLISYMGWILDNLN